MEEGELIPLLIAAGGGGNAYMEDPEFNPDLVQLEQYENSTAAPSTSGQTGAAGNTQSRLLDSDLCLVAEKEEKRTQGCPLVFS